jgi:hypothetical protein
MIIPFGKITRILVGFFFPRHLPGSRVRCNIALASTVGIKVTSLYYPL